MVRCARRMVSPAGHITSSRLVSRLRRPAELNDRATRLDIVGYFPFLYMPLISFTLFLLSPSFSSLSFIFHSFFRFTAAGSHDRDVGRPQIVWTTPTDGHHRLRARDEDLGTGLDRYGHGR